MGVATRLISTLMSRRCDPSRSSDIGDHRSPEVACADSVVRRRNECKAYLGQQIFSDWLAVLGRGPESPASLHHRAGGIVETRAAAARYHSALTNHPVRLNQVFDLYDALFCHTNGQLRIIV